MDGQSSLSVSTARSSLQLLLMKSVSASSSRPRGTGLPAAVLLCGAPLAMAAPLYSESFDSQATAKVLVNKAANTDLLYVDYSSFVRDVAGGGGAATIQIPEAPNRIVGSAPTKGVLMFMTYNGIARALNLRAADSPGGPAKVFTGNYRMSCDMWLSIAPDAVNGTTDVGLFGVGHSGTNLVSYANRATAVGTYGWCTSEGGIGANGDVTLLSLIPGTPAVTTAIFRKENIIDAPLFNQAFLQGTPFPNTPAGQWTQVDMVVVDNKATLYMNGVNFGAMPNPGTTDGFATIGYEDPFTGSNPSTGSLPFGILQRWNRQFGLFDNFVVESLPGPPALEAAVSIPFAPVTFINPATLGQFRITTTDLNNSYNITGAAIDGPNAADFSLATPFPQPVNINASALVDVNFTPSFPNGLRVARLKLTTSDPNLPEVNFPLQARREVRPTTITQSVLAPAVGSVSVQNGTNTTTITIKNDNVTPVLVQAPVITGIQAAMFSVPGTFPVEVVAGESVTLPLIFTPTGTIGLKSANIEFATNDPNVPLLTLFAASRYAFGPPLLAQYKMDDTSGTTLVDAAAASPAASLVIRQAPFEFSQPSLLPGVGGFSVRFKAAETTTTGNYAVSLAPHLPNVTYCFWISPETKTQTTRRNLLLRSSVNTVNGTLYSLYLNSLGRLVFDVGSTTAIQTEDNAISDGTTYHIALTHSDLNGFGNTTATRSRLYINGVLIGEALEPVKGFTDYELNVASEGLHIASGTGAGAGFVGLMDDLQIYSIELSGADIAGMFSQPGKTAFNLETLDYRITNVLYDAGTGSVTLTWNSAAGAVYSVQQSTFTSGFTDVPGQTGIASGGVSTTAVFTAPAGSRRFFQIRRTSP